MEKWVGGQSGVCLDVDQALLDIKLDVTIASQPASGAGSNLLVFGYVQGTFMDVFKVSLRPSW